MLEGKVIIVTGASAGIGEETALELAKYKTKLVLVARREKRLESLAKKVQELGAKALVVEADLTKVDELSRIVPAALKEFGKIDVLANIAGWGVYKWFEEYSFEEVQDQFLVNVLGLAELCRQVIPVMKKQHSGHIINMSSYASKIVFPPLSVYSSTKYAVEGLSDGLRRELRPWGISVSRVHPSPVSGTEFNQKSLERGGVQYQSSSFGRISKQFVAKKVIQLMEHPKSALFLGRLYDIPVFINHYFPWLVDLAAFFWVKRKRKI